MATDTNPEDLVSQVAAKYDDGDGAGEALRVAALRRLEWRRRRGRKRCDRCREDKPPSCFRTDSREPDGLRRYCRDCIRAMNRAAYARRIKS